MTTAQHTAPLVAYPVARFLKYLPQERRGALPRILNRRVGASFDRVDTIEAALVTIEPFEGTHAATGRDWPARLPHLDVHYAAGWQFGYSTYGQTHKTLLVYLWRSIPELAEGLRP